MSLSSLSQEHSYKIRNTCRFKNFLFDHFLTTGHSFKYVNIQLLQKIASDDDVFKGFKLQARYSAELDWIKKLQTPFPLGLNDSFHQEGK